MHHQIDSLAYGNQLRSLPPEHKLGFAIALFLLGYLASAPVQGGIALWLGVWTVGYAGIPIQIYGQLLLVPLGFAVMSVPALTLGIVGSAHRVTVQGDVWRGIDLGPLYLYISDLGIHQAGTMLIRAIALTSCLYFILLTVPFVEILRVLRQIGCPPLIVELMALMYRFIFVLVETVTELLWAQHSRNGYRTWSIGMRSVSLAIGQLLQRSLDNYRQISLGLASRGFTGQLQVWHPRRHKPRLRYTIEAVGGYVVLLALAGWTHAHGI